MVFEAAVAAAAVVVAVAAAAVVVAVAAAVAADAKLDSTPFLVCNWSNH